MKLSWRRNDLLIGLSVAMFAASLCFDGFYSGKSLDGAPGVTLFLFGWIGVLGGYVAWLANPAFLAAWAIRRVQPRVFLMLATAAPFMTLSFLFHREFPSGPGMKMESIESLGPGYLLWLAAQCLLA